MVEAAVAAFAAIVVDIGLKELPIAIAVATGGLICVGWVLFCLFSVCGGYSFRRRSAVVTAASASVILWCVGVAARAIVQELATWGLIHFPVTFTTRYRANGFFIELPVSLCFEGAAVVVGAMVFGLIWQETCAPRMPRETRFWFLAGVLAGAFAGSSLPAWIYGPPFASDDGYRIDTFIANHSIIAVLLCATAGGVAAKRVLHIGASVSDCFVFPLLIAIVLWRIGSFVAGLTQMTFGTPTRLALAFDFGDGIWRHPTALYEILFAGLLIGVLTVLRPTRAAAPPGTTFRIFMTSYLSFCFAVDWIQPTPKGYFGLSAIHVASFVGTSSCVYPWLIVRSSNTSAR